MQPYLSRALEPLIRAALQTFPAVLVTGGRQTGKTTCLQHLLPDMPYASFDRFADLEAVKRDPRLFLQERRPPLLIDEIQYAPEILRLIKGEIDAHRHVYGQYILTGSQFFPLMQGASESLAGRVAIFELFPLSWQELGIPMPTPQETLHQMVQGFYPEFIANPSQNRMLWFDSFLMTYIERDIRQIKPTLDIGRFQRFLLLLAARAGQLLNLSEIAKETGISQPTAREWVEMLEATYIIRLLQPYSHNVTKRVVKTPKLHFVDTGLLCHLLGLHTPEQLASSPFLGHVFENMVVMEAIKRLAIHEPRGHAYFYRTSNDLEVDLLIQLGTTWEAYEIKWGSTPHRSQTHALAHLAEILPLKRASLLTPLSERLPLAPHISAEHWGTLLHYTAIS